ncbi:hypothetical protein BN1012_Phect1171 [Candidatus Phaeomarinobacter ectocarpi]|uniref:Uncharacterized protein n=1 Tax=Candidatus Phaeomarinibacter ectocarpi TaxID=1458461 RepID=X5MLC9_9HYPH|nr:hypothetical protein BN1012_Phect1171 [Candidatus Phaeomarinobacter ectocarpi]
MGVRLAPTITTGSFSIGLALFFEDDLRMTAFSRQISIWARF